MTTKLDPNQTKETALERTRRVFLNIFAASSTTMFFVSLMNPIDVLRIKWQTKPPSDQRTLLIFAKDVARPHFFRNLFLPGIFVNAASVGTSSGLRLGLYPLAKELLNNNSYLPFALSPSVRMFAAGFLSGSVGFFLATPFFTAKIQAQSYFATKSGFHYLKKSIFESNPFRGSSVLVTRGALFSAGFSVGYDGTKQQLKALHFVENSWMHGFASLCGAFLATGLAAPFDAILTQFNANRAKSVMFCVRNMYSQGGIPIFFRGWSLFFSRVAPLFLVQLPVYEQVRKYCGMNYM